ncbi:MAG: efflux RND transporter periplasmic adaptor subunit [bacterium]
MNLKSIQERLKSVKDMKKNDIRNIAISLVFAAIILTVAYGAIARYINRDKIFASGTIEAIETEVSTRVPGRVISFLAGEGDTLQKGTIIASLESSELYANFRQTVAVERSAQIRYENAKRNYARAKSLTRKNMISDQDYDAVSSNYEAAESELNRASAAKAVAEILYNEANIRAPISGTIFSKAAEVGDLLAPYSAVVTMADLAELDMMLYVPEARYGKIKLGDEVDVSVDSFPREKFSGKVVYISNRAEFTPKNIQTKEERVTQVFGIKIKIPNPDLKLKPGMPADAVIYLSN